MAILYGNYRGRYLRRASAPLFPLQQFNSAVQLVALLNQECNDMFCRHETDGTIASTVEDINDAR